MVVRIFVFVVSFTNFLFWQGYCEVSDAQDDGEVSDAQDDGEVSDAQDDNELSDAQDDGEESDAQDDEIGTSTMTSEQAHKLHNEMDSDKNGLVTLREILNFSMHVRKRTLLRDLESISEEMDTDGDGKLSLPEVLKNIVEDSDEPGSAEKQRALESAKFKAADANGDSLLESDEIISLFFPETNDAVLTVDAAATMKNKDKNHDGELDPSEFWEVDEEDATDTALSEEDSQEFKIWDKDGNGRLNLEEFKRTEHSTLSHTDGILRQFFEVADKDNDTHINREELHDAQHAIAESGAQDHFMEWIEHMEL